MRGSSGRRGDGAPVAPSQPALQWASDFIGHELEGECSQRCKTDGAQAGGPDPVFRPPPYDSTGCAQTEECGDEHDPRGRNDEQYERRDVVERSDHVGMGEVGGNRKGSAARCHQGRRQDTGTGPNYDRNIESQDCDREPHPERDHPTCPRFDLSKASDHTRIFGSPEGNQDWAHKGEEVGDAHEIAQDPITVHPHEGQELPQDLEMTDDDEDQ